MSRNAIKNPWIGERVPGAPDWRRVKWGDSQVWRTGPGGAQNWEAMSLLVNVPKVYEFPVVYCIDLEIIDTATGAPPPALHGGRFRISYGTASDTRIHDFEPGIHSVIGEALQVRFIPGLPLFAPVEWRYCAHCTIQDGVSPSYVYV